MWDIFANNRKARCGSYLPTTAIVIIEYQLLETRRPVLGLSWFDIVSRGVGRQKLISTAEINEYGFVCVLMGYIQNQMISTA